MKENPYDDNNYKLIVYEANTSRVRDLFNYHNINNHGETDFAVGLG